MIVKIKYALPQLLCPTIERFVVDEKEECIGDLFGYYVKNRFKENVAVITDVFTYMTSDADIVGVDGPEKFEIERINENLEGLLEDHKIRLGDYHTHIISKKLNDPAYNEKTQKNFIRQFMHGTKYSPGDKEDMKKTGELYLVVGFGKKILPHKKSLYICPDKKSLFGVLPDFVYCISAFHYSRKAKRFKKALVTL